MKHLFLLLFCGLITAFGYSQSFSNKGTDFWVTYPAHIDGTSSVMGIYITATTNATGTISVNGTTVPFTVTANAVTEKFIGSTAAADASNSYVYLSANGIKTGAAIHIVSNDNPVVVYAHIIHSARSGATLLLPSNVWGQTYVVPSYGSIGKSAGSGYGTITVVAANANTNVQITPTVNTLDGHSAGVAYTINLPNPGDVYQMEFTQSADISGTIVQSITNGSACQKIAVFSSTTWSAFGCASASSGDNLFQQLFPTGAWGENFVTVPAKTRTSDIIRVYVTDPTTVVTKIENNITTTLSGMVTGISNSSYYYEYSTGNATYLQASKPISVVQYFTTMACQNGALIGDPEMIVLNPIEQTINNITVFSAHENWINNRFPGQSNITNCYLNIVIRSNATGSFKINGTPQSGFVAIPGTTYSYLQADVTSITLSNPVQNLTADSNFIAIAYGFGNVESYGYNAGTNVKDFSQIATFQNKYVTLDSPIACVNTPIKFSVPLSFQPTSMQWDFSKAPDLNPNTAPAATTPASYLDSNSVNGLYYYSTKTTYTFTAPNTSALRDTIKLYTTSATPDGCGSSSQSYSIPVAVYGLPSANFTISATGCVNSPVKFLDATNTHGTSSIIAGFWTFGDGSAVDSAYNPTNTYTAAGNYNVRYQPISSYGCLGDTTIPIFISSLPVANFGISDTTCLNKTITLSDSSTIATGTIAKWYWNYGNGLKDTLTTNINRSITYTSSGVYNDTLTVQSNSGCLSNFITKPITVHVLPVPNFNLPIVCMPVGAAQFYDSSTISDGTQNGFKYLWSFGDGGIDSVKNPLHYYSGITPETVKLSVASLYGCVKDTSKTLSTLYLQPLAGFKVSSEVCLRDTTIFTDTSNGLGSNIVKWKWSFGDGGTDTLQNTKHRYTKAGTDSVQLFVYTDKGCISDTAIQTTIVDTLPLAKFNFSAAYYCETRPVTFTDQSIPYDAGAITNWYWNMGNGDIKNLTNNTAFTESYATYGKDTVQLAVQSSKGCKSDTVNQVITLNPLPHVGFTLPEVCLSDALANFSDTSTIADGTAASFTYLWNFNNSNPVVTPGPVPLTATAKNASTHYNIYGHYIVSLKVTSNNGCDSTLSKAFTVNGSTPKANFVIADSASLCSNLPVVFRDLSTVDFGTVSYEDIYWKPSVDSIDLSPDSLHQKTYAYLYPDFQTPATQKYLVKLVAHSGISSVCADSVTQTIILHQSPKVQFTTLPGICNDTTARQITQAKEITGVANMPGLGVYYGTGVNATGTFTPQLVAPGTYPVKYVYTTTTYGCADSATQNETVWPSPVAKWGISSPDCALNNITFTDSSVANYSNIVSRFWNYGDGNYTTLTNGNSFTKQYASANTYTVSLRVQTDSGCRSAYNIQNIKVNYLPNVNFGLPVICLPIGKGQFIDSSAIGDNSQSLFTHLWNFGDPNDPTPSTLPNPIHQYSSVGPFNVSLKITTKDNCVDSLTKVFNTVYAEPKAAFTASSYTVCMNDNIQFTDNSSSLGSVPVQWVWDLANGNSSSLQNPSKAFSDSGTFTISMYFYSQQGCLSDTATKQVVVNPYPVLNMGPSLFVLQGGTLPIIPTYVYGTNLQYLWTPATYLSSDTASHPLASPPADITYSLALTGIGGCTVNGSVFITVLKSPIVPNAFSPNGDGINDTWEIKYLNSYPGATVMVFDRYGEAVFSSVNYTKNWDGTYNGKPLPLGTYYYIIDPKNGRQKMSGSVTILR
jgi:gliding motility-associated-like protein